MGRSDEGIDVTYETTVEHVIVDEIATFEPEPIVVLSKPAVDPIIIHSRSA